MNKNYLYFSHSDNSVLIYLFKTDFSLENNTKEDASNLISHNISISKQKLQECLVEEFSQFMKDQQTNLDTIDAIYMRDIESTWNANRLVCLFVKTMAHYKNIPIYIGTIEEEINFEEKKYTNIINTFKTFDKLDKSINLQPFYNLCPIINT